MISRQLSLVSIQIVDQHRYGHPIIEIQSTAMLVRRHCYMVVDWYYQCICPSSFQSLASKTQSDVASSREVSLGCSYGEKSIQIVPRT